MTLDEYLMLQWLARKLTERESREIKVSEVARMALRRECDRNLCECNYPVVVQGNETGHEDSCPVQVRFLRNEAKVS